MDNLEPSESGEMESRIRQVVREELEAFQQSDD